MTSSKIRTNLLSAIPDFAAWPPEGLEALAAAAQERELQRGEVLIKAGEPPDALYFVLSGRFSVHLNDVSEPIAEIGRGQPIGEIGFFAGLPRTATVAALRDSRVLCITRERFELLKDLSPAIRDAVIVSLARRLSKSINPGPEPAVPARAVTILCAGGSSPSLRFVEALREALGRVNRAVFLTQRDIAERFAGSSLGASAISDWLNAVEADSEFVVYVAEQELTDWTKVCIRQADAILLVAISKASTELNPCELFAFSVHPSSARRLVILHDARTQIATGTSSWLARRDVFMHHHVALQDRTDVERVVRFLSGNAVGFVAGGGGGALGSAHLGAYKAFREAGVEFDILGGTSVGAGMTAALAYGLTLERIDDGMDNIFVKERAFRRPTLPRYGLLDHKPFDRALRAEFGDVLIEDLWRPFFAVSTDLANQKPKIHRQGPVWQAIRASSAVPGVLPPFFTAEGEMLADGALMDNVPLRPMKALKTGPNVIVSLGLGGPTSYAVDYDSIPGAREMVAAMLNPFARRRLPQPPTILQIVMLSMHAHWRRDLELSETDILIAPELPPEFRLTSWERHKDIFAYSYQHVASWIAARVAEKDPALRSVLPASR
jgi:NTE family protein